MYSLPGKTQFRVHLTAKALVACEVERSRWHGTTIKRKASFGFSRDERAAAMDELALWMTPGSGRRSIDWVVGPAHAQYFVLPWTPALANLGLRDAYARARFEQLYERDANTAAFCFGAASQGSSQLVSWVAAELPLELARHAQRTGCHLEGVTPALVTVWDRFKDVLETESGTLCIVDGDRQAVVQHDRQRIEDIAIRPCGKPAPPQGRSTGVFRRFSTEYFGMPAKKLASDLSLPAQRGFAAQQDGAYAFALCGAL